MRLITTFLFLMIRSAKELFGSQSWDTLTVDAMRLAYEVNTIGPLRVTKALLPQVAHNHLLALHSAVRSSEVQ